MAIRHRIDPQTLGTRLARVLCNDPRVRELWIEPQHEEVVFWLITEPIDMNEHRELHGASMAVFEDERFEDALFEMHILDPRHYPEGYDLHQSIPSRAVRVDLAVGA
jgi:hypothetical protein